MGVQNFFKIVIKDDDGEKHTFDEYGVNVVLKDIKDHSIVVDGNIILHESITTTSPDKLLRTKDGILTQHIKFVLNKMLMFYKANIKQVWIFDNSTQNPYKAEENARRKEIRKKNGTNILKTEHYEELFRLLTMLGITYFIAPPEVEAEQVGSWFCQMGLADYIYSTDSDVLLYQGNLFRTQRYKENGRMKKRYQIYVYEQFMNAVDLTHEEMLQIATIMGHDFHKTKIKGISVGSVYERVKSGKVPRFNNTQLEALVPYNYDKEDYMDDVEIYEGSRDVDGLIEWLTSLEFNETKLRKQLSVL